MTRVAFVRHGRATVADGLCIGHTDVPLSPEGESAIKALAASAHLRGVRIVSSDLRRASESAALLAPCHPERSEACPEERKRRTGSAPRSYAVHHDRRLREMNFGEWDGRSWSDIERADSDRFRDWMERWVDLAPPRGESAADVARRAAEWITDALSASDEQIVVVSHAGWIRAALCHLLNRSLAQMFDIPVDHAHATIVDVIPGGAMVVAANVASLDAIGSS